MGQGDMHRKNRSTGKDTSQPALPLHGIDRKLDELEDWEEALLDLTLGSWPQKRIAGTEHCAASGAMPQLLQPIINVKTPAQSALEAERMFEWGVDAQKRATELLAPPATKYTDDQMVHLMAFCGLDPTEKHLLPPIWTELQKVKGWKAQATKLVNIFTPIYGEDDIPIFFHKELVEDIVTLAFARGPAPIPRTAHGGISPLAFSLLTVDEQAQLRMDQNAREESSSTTQDEIKAGMRRCPVPPQIFEELMMLLRQYISTLR